VRLSYQLDTTIPGCLSTGPYQQTPFINKTLSTETSYQQGLIVGKLGTTTAPSLKKANYQSVEEAAQ
jgi:hypothetical protein